MVDPNFEGVDPNQFFSTDLLRFQTETVFGGTPSHHAIELCAGGLLGGCVGGVWAGGEKLGPQFGVPMFQIWVHNLGPRAENLGPQFGSTC